MAKELFAGPLRKEDDWGSVSRANGNPASGAAVQAFIKDQLKSKFGSLYFDEEANQYIVFADDTDRDLWVEDRNVNAALELTRFNAPAPATIKIFNQSAAREESLLTASGRAISFNFFIQNSAGAASYEGVSVRVSFNLSSSTYVRTYTPGANWDNEDIGTHVEIGLDDYLTVAGDWEITVSITTLTTNVTTSIVFFHTVTQLELTVPFDSSTPLDINDGSFRLDYHVIGGGASPKMLEIFVDEQLYTGHEIEIGSSSNIEDFLTVSMADTTLFGVGKHNLQIRSFIQSSTDSSKKFYSDTLYYDFVVYDSTDVYDETYILYLANIVTDPDGAAIDEEKLKQFTVNQYTDAKFKFIAINTKKNQVHVKVSFEKTNLQPNETPSVSETTMDVNNGETFEIVHQFQAGGTYDFKVYELNSSAAGTLQFQGDITVKDFSFEGETVAEQQPNAIILKYHGLNRTNTLSDKDIWPNIAANAPENSDAILNNVVFKEGQSGWENHALVLSNGATLTIPVNIFDKLANVYSNNLGMTFEIEFETFDSQDDAAIVMDYSDPDNNSFLKITSTSASMGTNNGRTLTTNFKDNSKNKIAFVFHPLKIAEGNRLTQDADLIQIFVNGILDRVGQWGDGISTDSDSIVWTNPTTQNIVIGNPAGETGVKIYDIRIYNRALSQDECFMNWVIDQGSDIPKIMERNNIYKTVGNERKIDLDLVKAKIPTMVMYTDFETLNNRKEKKDNTMYNLEYFDPIDPTLNFYVRNAWVSLQGTSSMYYPTKNLRPYFNKALVSGEKKGNSFPWSIMEGAEANEVKGQGVESGLIFSTELWPISQYSGKKDDEFIDNYLDENGILPYSVNSKVNETDGTNIYHEVACGKSSAYKIKLVRNYIAKNSDLELYKKIADKQFEMIREYDDADGQKVSVLAQAEEILNENGSIYFSAYRPLRRNGWDINSNEYWTYLRQLKMSGVKIFSRKAVKNTDGETINYSFSNLKKKKIEKGVEYYGLGCYWRQYDGDVNVPHPEPNHYSGWTDRWTLKADYAESSMSHNGGIGRLWGTALKNLQMNTGERDEWVGQTGAQLAITEKGNSLVDIRTSCDGKPIVLFIKDPIGYEKDEDGNYTGRFIWGEPRFVGLYNIMTDKSSTALFGFEDIYNEEGKIWDAKNVECWEYLGNGSAIGQGLSVAYDDGNEVTYDKASLDKSGWNYGEDRFIYQDGLNFEPRWPEDGSAKHEEDMRFYQDDVFGVETTNIETFFNWLHFCKPAVDYTVDGIDGYTFSPFIPFASYQEAADWKRANPGKTIYIGYTAGGNDQFAAEGESYEIDDKKNTAVFTFDIDNPNDFPSGWTLYWYKENINYNNVYKEASKATIPYDIYKTKVYSFDSNNRFWEDGNINNTEADKYAVETFAWKSGNGYRYIDNYGVEQSLPSSEIDENDFVKDGSGESYAGKTYMKFFEDTMDQHLDLYKVAAYYVYFSRFGAVDQVLKNQMMTTMDGQHWFFINYDNDTILGVRNDAILAFNWDVDRDTWDFTGNSFAYAGSKSVLWNTLSKSSKFMNIVRNVDRQLSSSKLLSADTVLAYLNEKQSDSWCERLYNAQEEIKYISTYKNDIGTVRFLNFCQGNRKSHRNWWVTNRWLLYDAEWNSGTYLKNMLGFYMEAMANPNNPVPYLKITASSKYTFRVTINNNDNVVNEATLTGPGKPNHSITFSLVSETTKGNPCQFIGPQKVKVFNFRPAAKLLAGDISMYVNYTEGGEAKNWVKTDGSTMTKFLIGNGATDIATTKIMGIEAITTLEEIDIRNCSHIETNVTLSPLSNLHIYRAKGSSVSTFEPSKGAMLYEVSLPDSITTMTLNNVTFTTSPTDYIVYQEGENNDALPYSLDDAGNISGIYTNETAYKYTPESKSIFEYTPTAKLTSVTFNEVAGLNTKKFIMDWSNAITATKTLSSCSLNLTNVDWSSEEDAMTVTEFVNFVNGTDLAGNPIAVGKFNFVNLTGVIAIKSDDATRTSISIDEYNTLIDLFNKDGRTNIFSDGYNGLRLTTSEGIFYQAEGSFKTYEVTASDLQRFRTYAEAGANFYQLIRGNDLKLRANIFPQTNDEYVYVMVEFDGNFFRSYTIDASDSSLCRIANAGITATKQRDGSVIVSALENAAYTSQNMYALIVAKRDPETGNVMLLNGQEFIVGNSNDTQLNGYAYSEQYKYVVYLKAVNKVLPTNEQLSSTIDGVTSNSLTIDDKNHEYKVRIILPESTNATVTDIAWNSSIAGVLGEDGFVHISDWKYVADNIIEVTVTGEIQSTKISFNLDAVLTFNTTATNKTRTRRFAVTVDIKKLDNMKLVLLDEEFNEIGEQSSLVYIKPGKYIYKVKFDDYNVAIANATVKGNVVLGNVDDISSASLNEEKNLINPINATSFVKYNSNINPEENIFVVNIENNYDTATNTFKSYYISLTFTIKYVDEFGYTIDKEYVSNIELAYPNNMYLDYSINGVSKGIVGKNDIEISLLNNQGTSGDGSHKVLNGNSPIEFKVTSDVIKVEQGSSGLVEKEPTVKYNVTIDNVTIKNKEAGGITYDITTSLKSSANVGDEKYHGNDILSVNIPAQNNEVSTVIISGKYTVHYDSTYDGELDASDLTRYDIENNFSITINYKVIDAISVNPLEADCIDVNTYGNFYLVDEGGDFYMWPADNNIAGSTIATAIRNGVTFAGLGKASADPKFMYLIKSEELNDFNITTNEMFNVNSTVQWFGGSVPSNNTSNGDNNTKVIVRTLKSNATTFETSKFYAIYNNYVNGAGEHRNNGVNYNYLYIPAINELVTLLGSSDTAQNDLFKINEIISVLNEVTSGKYFNLLDYILINKFWANDTNVQNIPVTYDEADLLEENKNIFVLISSTDRRGAGSDSLIGYCKQYNKENGQMYNVKDKGDNVMGISVNGTCVRCQAYYAQTGELYQIYRNENYRLLPFLKVK